MSRIDVHTREHRPLVHPASVSPAPCPSGAGLGEHRLCARPVINDLLEHVPGDVPFSTHLGLENARARLLHRQLGAVVAKLHAGHGHHRTDWGSRAAGPAGAPLAVPTVTPDVRRPPAVVCPVQRGGAMAYAQQRARWPLGGLIDLVI